MLWIYTLFSWREYPYLPLVTGVYDGERLDFLTLYLPGTGRSLFEIEQNRIRLQDAIKGQEVTINEFKSHLTALELPLDIQYLSYETHQPRVDPPETLAECKRLVAKGIAEALTTSRDRYRMVLAHAQVVYAAMEQRGVFFGNREVHPIYELTISGRSRTSGDSIQGAGDEMEVYPANLEHNYMVHLDWIAADLRVASIMSEDKQLQATYKTSDPYSAMSAELTTPAQEITRNDCKLDFFRSIYSLNLDSPSIMYYETLHRWLKKMEAAMDSTGVVKSILGREFRLTDGNLKNRRSVFNSMLQGSVAHAMHSALRRIYKLFPENVMTETHDAIILSGRKPDLMEIIKGASEIMLHPLKLELETNPSFPVRVSVGTAWRQWRKLKEFR